MVYSKATALELVKERLDILPGQTARDRMLETRIDGAAAQLNRMGIRIAFEESGAEEDGMDDLMLVVDLTVWQIQNRDKAEDDPPWLRRRLRERWLSERRVEA